jgi:hypothetical protein
MGEMWDPHITSHHFHISLSTTIHPLLFMHTLSSNTPTNFPTERASKEAFIESCSRQRTHQEMEEADGDEVGLAGPTTRPPGLPFLFFKFPSSLSHFTHLGTQRT